MKTLTSAVLLALLLVGCAAKPTGDAKPKAEAKPDLTCGVIHMPKQGCPEGYIRELYPRFTERNGSKEFACIDRLKEQCTDVLMPGESEGIQFEIHFEDSPPGGPRI